MRRSHYKFLLTDLDGVREKGFEFFEESENWPVKEKEFSEFYNFTRSLYNKIISNVSDTEISDIALVENIFIRNIIDIFHYNYIHQYCSIENIKLNSSNESDLYFYPDWKNFGNYYAKLATIYDRVKGFIKNNVKNIVFNRHMPISKLIHGLVMGSNIVGIGSNDRIKQEYIISNGIFCDNKDGHKLIKKAVYLFSKNRLNCSTDEACILFSEKIIDPFILELSNTDSMFIKGIDLNLIKKAWLQRFTDAYKIYKGLFLIDMPKVLLVTETGKPYSKIITLVFQRRGCRVFNFHHGNSSVLLDMKLGYQSLFGHCDNYVVDTELMRTRFEELLNDNQINARKTTTNFISVDSNYYANLRKIKHHIKPKRVMLMGYPMNLSRYPDTYEFFYYKVTLEHMLADVIKHSGYYVSYKAHPDRFKEIQSIMDDVSDEVVKQPFEDVWQESGVLVFTYVTTSTFGYALNLSIPIVLIEMPGTPWYKNMREIIEKRVEIIQVQMTNGRISIDRDKLVNAINASRSKINLDVAKEITG
ncbi:hypothetical protein HOL24_07525 [bacterium]|nr:hypothetical protein [bacterium]